MKKKFAALAAAVFILASMILPVYAQLDVPYIKYWEDGIPYDADGLPIEIGDEEEVWCIDETQEDENKAFILLDPNYDIVEERDIPYEEDASDALEDESGDAETGWLTIKASVPEEAFGTDVIVSITNGSSTEEYRLYSDNDYEKTVELTTGSWDVLNCYLSGDDLQAYTADYSGSVDITNAGAHTLDITLQSNTGLANLYLESADASSDASGDASGDLQDDSGFLPANSLFFILIAAVLCAALSAIILFLKSNKE